MNIMKRIVFVTASLVLFFLVDVSAVKAADVYCFCATKLDWVSAGFVSEYQKNPGSKTMLVADSKQVSAGNCKTSVTSTRELFGIKDNMTGVDCTPCKNEKQCKTLVSAWNTSYTKIAKKGASTPSSTAASAGSEYKSSISGYIELCSKGVPLSEWPPECKDISIFVLLALDIVSYIFSIIGALALGVFVFGGFKLIFSQGNPEKVKEGTGAMVNAVLGIIIAFCGYVLISYIGQVVGIKEGFGLL